jgi:hypothetical protein
VVLMDAGYTIQYVTNTLTILPAPTTGQLTSSSLVQLPNNGVTFTFTASADAPVTNVPVGNMRFRRNGAYVTGLRALSSTGTTTLNYLSLPIGWHTVVAEYPGTNNFLGTTNTLMQLINTPPVAVADSISRPPFAGTKVTTNLLLANDFDVDAGHSVTFHSVSNVSSQGGSVSFAAGWVHYSPPDGYTGPDSFTYWVTDSLGQPTVSGTVNVGLSVNLVPSPNQTLTLLGTAQGSNTFRLRFDGIPGLTYRVEYATNLAATYWMQLTTGTANPFGVYVYEWTEAIGSDMRLYRTVYP